ncbi:MAPEG family protein [Sphingomonas astaxanthinifaciens]|uniref:Membrane protein n=1 Tax=Sphingomonas astaxanthinifaciens DSM 22298 TaxID=1123267 RepID=A0ABQ5Z8W5_9SPHN|nr:MAPEG family protein [Sphingomonas astaxanthinifaciens]GLR48441.1 membrane protein [Sphingomonas astaxanthinifaciens DSM 22298]
MISTALLGPVVALVAWSLLVLFVLGFVRFGAIKRAGIKVDPSRGGRGQDLEGVLDRKANWPAHNYAHLMEQPTLFYAIMLSLAIMGFDHPMNVALAWAYVAIRVVHSLVQIFVNDLRVRFPLFVLGTICLAGLTLHAAMALWH